MQLEQIRELCSHITMELLGTTFTLHVERDRIYGQRVYLQVAYIAPCTKTGDVHHWSGGKHYLSGFMTEDEIVKRAYVAFEQAIKHELMEGFKFDGTIVFNPHVDFRALLEISHKETKRSQNVNSTYSPADTKRESVQQNIISQEGEKHHY